MIWRSTELNEKNYIISLAYFFLIKNKAISVIINDII
jgi:hypothetical protein